MNAQLRARDWFIGALELAVAIAALVVGTQYGKIHSSATH
jgi:hypothetical protein